MAFPFAAVGQGILGILTFLSGQQAQSMSDRAIQRMLDLSEEEMVEVRELRKILSDPNNPVRRMLMDEGLRNIRGNIVTGQQNLSSQLASRGFQSGSSQAGPLAALEAAGIRSAGEFSRGALADFLTQRISLARPGAAFGPLSSIADISGRSAAYAGESLGGLLSLLTGRSSAAGTRGYNPYGVGRGRYNPLMYDTE